MRLALNNWWRAVAAVVFRKLRVVLAQRRAAPKIQLWARSRFTRVSTFPRKPPAQPLVVLAQIASWFISRRRRQPTRPTTRIRVFGYATRRPPVRAIRTLLFASKARALLLRIRGTAHLSKAVRTFGVAVAPRFPRRIRALFVRRRTPRVAVHFTRTFGHVTRRPPIRAIRAVLFASQATRRRLSLRTRAMVLHPIGRSLALPDSTFYLISSSFGTLKIVGSFGTLKVIGMWKSAP